MNPKRCWSRSWRSWQWWFLWWFQRNAWMRHMPTTWRRFWNLSFWKLRCWGCSVEGIWNPCTSWPWLCWTWSNGTRCILACFSYCVLNLSVWWSCFNAWTSVDKSSIICNIWTWISCIPVPLSRRTGGDTAWSLRTVVSSSCCWVCWVSNNLDCDSNRSLKKQFSAITAWSCCWEFWYAWFATVCTSVSYVSEHPACSRSWLALISTPFACEPAASTACWAWASIPWTCCNACCSISWAYWLASLWISSTFWGEWDSTTCACAMAEAATLGSMPIVTCWCNYLWSYSTLVVEGCCIDPWSRNESP